MERQHKNWPHKEIQDLDQTYEVYDNIIEDDLIPIAIRNYYYAISNEKRKGADNEQNLRPIFYDLLKYYTDNLKLEIQYEQMERSGDKINYPDARISRDNVCIGHIENKDKKDDLFKEIEKKLDRGYPCKNILFENTVDMVLYQDCVESDRIKMDNPQELDRVLRKFINYKITEQKDFLDSKDKLILLVDLFRENIDVYKTTKYDESNTRTDFIDKFFILLGWDVLNDKGYSEDYREVVREDKVSIEGKIKAPDYSFRLDGNRKFFVEAKKPIVNIQEERDPAYQVRRYGYSAGCSISILTDFEEFAIYDTRIKPNPNDTAKVARIFYCTYEDYEAKFDELVASFSPEGIRKGAFDKYVKANKKGTGTVDTDFLNTLSEWRLELAEAIAKKNKELDEIDLNHIVQKIMNRIVFLRFAEDRGTTEYGLLKRLLSVKKDFYEQLIIVFDEARTRYNSDLFSQDNKLNIVLEDKVVKDIISNLYYPNCPYEFNVIPVELLGMIYERFLGDTITLDDKGKAKVEEKPETRKAGGVYYTPSYIVDYIVEYTVGKLLKGKKPDEISEMAIVDPACGSGSFLIGVYAYLLNWYLEKYKAEKKYKKFLCAEGTKVILQEKKDILIRHIYGVDLDSQAVEVSKLSLLLKLMEDEGAMDSAGLSFTYLPNLEHNIKAGNSLVSKDYLDTLEVILFDKREQYKVKVFEWENEFTSVFKNGGFDVVVGNPPYVFTRDVSWGEELKDYFSTHYQLSNTENRSKSNQSGKVNLYALFLLQCKFLLKEHGLGGFIIPNGILRTTTYDTTRKFILDNYSIKEIVDLKDGVFKGVSVPTVILIFENNTQLKNDIRIINANYKKDKFVNTSKESYVNQQLFLNNTSYTFNIFAMPKEIELFIKMKNNLILGHVTINIIEGIVCKKEQILLAKSDDLRCKPFLEGKNIKKYRIDFANKYINFDRKELHRARPDEVWESPVKIIIQRISGGNSPLIATIDRDNYYSFASTNLILIKSEYIDTYSYEVVCALLNSKLVNFYYVKNFTNGSTQTVNISKTFLEQIPLPTLDLSNKKDKQLHDDLVAKVQLMLTLQKGDINDTTKLQIQALDQQIDNLVYEMYGLSEDEIKIIDVGIYK